VIVFRQSVHLNTQLCLFNFYQIQLIHNVVLVSDEHQSDSIICVCVHIYIYMCVFFFYILFHYRLFQDVEYNPLCYTVGRCWLSVLYIAVYIC